MHRFSLPIMILAMSLLIGFAGAIPMPEEVFDEFRKFSPFQDSINVSDLENDTVSPTWSKQMQSLSAPEVGDTVLLYAHLSDNLGLSEAILQTNESGEFQNITGKYLSPMDLHGLNSSWVVFPWRNPLVGDGATIEWRILFNDLAGNWNVTDTLSFIIKSKELKVPSSNTCPDKLCVVCVVWKPECGIPYYETITEALNIAADDDIIEVHPGTYTENITIDKRNLTIIGVGDPTIDALGAQIAVRFKRAAGDFSKLINFTITNASFGVQIDSNNTRITDLNISQLLSPAAIELSYANNNTVENVSVADAAIGINVQLSDNNTIENANLYTTGGVILQESNENKAKNVTLHASATWAYPTLDLDQSKHNVFVNFTNPYYSLIYFALSDHNKIEKFNLSGGGRIYSWGFYNEIKDLYLENGRLYLVGYEGAYNSIINSTFVDSYARIFLSHGTTIRDSNFTGTGSGYGIWISSVKDVIVENTNVENYNRGIYIEWGPGTIIRNVTSNSNYDGIYVRVTYGGVKFENVETANNERAGIFSTWENFGIRISNLTSKDNYYGLYFSGGNALINVSDSTIQSNNYGIYSRTSFIQEITSSNVTPNNLFDVYLTRSKYFELINTSFNKSKVELTAPYPWVKPISELTVKWLLDVGVVDQYDNPIQDADVTVRDVTTLSVFSGKTGADGWIRNIEVAEYLQTPDIITNFTPHTVTVEKGPLSETESIVMDRSKEIRFVLELLETTEVNATLRINVTTLSTSPISVYIQNVSDPMFAAFGYETPGSIDIFFNITANETFERATITACYNETKVLEAGINESTLRMYRWNETILAWEVIPDSWVDVGENCIWANVTEFSIFTGIGKIEIDVVPPMVEITSPEDGAKVSLDVIIDAVAVDLPEPLASPPAEITSVLIDGIEVSKSVPYIWDTTRYVGGEHTITVKAVDQPGNIGSDSITVIVESPMWLKKQVIQDLESLKPTVEKKAAKKIDEAIKFLDKSLAPDLWVDEWRLDLKKGKIVFEFEKVAVSHLQHVYEKYPTLQAELAPIIRDIVKADKLILQVAFCDAMEEEVELELSKKAIEYYSQLWKKLREGVEDGM
jgi:hypothetical protein